MAMTTNTLFSGSFRFQYPADIQQALTLAPVQQQVERRSPQYYQINVEKAMQDLIQVGQVLQLAIASSKDCKCNTSALAILSHYQDMTNASVIASGNFVATTLKALEKHQLAITLANRDKWDSVVKIFGSCGDLAKEMADEADQLVKKSDNLITLALTALTEANDE